MDATADEPFERDVAVELLTETARLWRKLGHYGSKGTFRIDGVTGPDEYSAAADNNLYTNLMAQQNLAAAAAVAAKYPDAARKLGVTDGEQESWRAAAAAMTIPFDAERGLHQQHESFTEYAEWDFAGTAPDKYPLLLHFPYFELYRKQAIKQADLVLAMHLRGDAFARAEGAQLRLLRGADGARLLAVGVHPGRAGGRDRAPGTGPRLPGRSRPGRPPGPAPEHPRRPAHGRPGGRLAGPGRGVRRRCRAGLGPLAFRPQLAHAGITRLRFRIRYRDRRLHVCITPAKPAISCSP